MSQTLAVDPSTVAPSLPPLDNSLGAVLLGSFLSLLMQGMVFHQSYLYFRTYQKDSFLLKAWVVVIVALETFISALYIHTCYSYMVSHYFDAPFLLGPTVWSLKISPLPACLSAVICECFFARRVWLISPKYRPLVITAIVFDLAFYGCYIAYVKGSWHAPDIHTYTKHSWLAALGSGFIEIGNAMMTAVLIRVLLQSRTGVKRTNMTLETLIRYSMTTGLLICVFEIVNILVATLCPGTLIFVPVCMVLTKISASSVLVALNARNFISGSEPSSIDPFSQFTSTVMRAPQSHIFARSSEPRNGVEAAQLPKASTRPDAFELRILGSTSEDFSGETTKGTRDDYGVIHCV
ncbi:hypothetical protein C8Q80DRAFT_1146360 [Daedaleopsis nitida]|nr:hypothetical protein C8Q80DRAFT_1146360 [Daedaleopsis nitida]